MFWGLAFGIVVSLGWLGFFWELGAGGDGFDFGGDVGGGGGDGEGFAWGDFAGEDGVALLEDFFGVEDFEEFLFFTDGVEGLGEAVVEVALEGGDFVEGAAFGGDLGEDEGADGGDFVAVGFLLGLLDAFEEGAFEVFEFGGGGEGGGGGTGRPVRVP